MTAHGNCASMSGVVPAGRSLPGQYRPAIIMCDRDNAMLRQPVLLLQFAVSSLRCAVRPGSRTLPDLAQAMSVHVTAVLLG